MQDLLTRQIAAAAHPPWCDPTSHWDPDDMGHASMCTRTVGRPEHRVNVEAVTDLDTPGSGRVVLWLEASEDDPSMIGEAHHTMTSDRAREIAQRLIDAADMVEGKRTLSNGGLYVPGSGPIKLGWVTA